MKIRLLSLLLLVGVLHLPAWATTFTVNTTNDNGNNGSPTAGSLRAAIVNANAGGAGPHTIDATGLSAGTINLITAALPAINVNVTINGPGANVLRVQRSNTAVATFTIFTVNSGKTVTFSGMTIARGSAANGGGIANNGGTVTMNNCTVVRDSATAAGGGINNANSSTMTLNNCTIDSNISTANGASGISNGNGTMTLNNCTVAFNSCVNTGGGIANLGTLNLYNCTVSGNTAASTAGGVYNGGTTARVINTIIAGNSAPTNPDVLGTFVSPGGHNLIGKRDGSSGFTVAGNSDQTGTVVSPLNAQLGPLQDNGGPTQTMALLSSSPAIDAGNDSVLLAPYSFSTDQRGQARKYNTHVDIGAFERGLNDISLPIELVEFGGSYNKGQVMLNWRTASEIDNAGFEVQRAESDMKFAPISSYLNDPSLRGLGTNAIGRDYNYTDNDPSLRGGGLYYYRIVDVSTDGIRSEHGAIAVEVADANAKLKLAAITPNPTRDVIVLNFTLPDVSPVTIDLSDVQGRRVITLVEGKEYAPGEHTEMFTTAGLSAGFYMVRMEAGGIVQMRKVIVAP